MLFWPILGWTALRVGMGIRFRLCITLMVSLAALFPWLVPPEDSGLRFFLLVPSLLMMGKAWEVGVGKPSNPRVFATPLRFWVWALVPTEGHWLDDAGERAAVRATAPSVALRIMLKICAAVLLLSLNDAIDLHQSLWISTVWMAFMTYFVLSMCIDGFGLCARLIGIDVPPAFNAPPLARNPREFWGRRWNLWFSRTSHRLIFEPIGGAKRPLLAASTVFLFSAVMHEYMVWVSLGAIDGRMFSFFILHGFATMAFTAFSRWRGSATRMPRAVAVALHLVWFTLSAPLFFGPVDEVFLISQWSLASFLSTGVFVAG
jgi:hypothetical protein